jgi:hypothetical protein
MENAGEISFFLAALNDYLFELPIEVLWYRALGAVVARPLCIDPSTWCWFIT